MALAIRLVRLIIVVPLVEEVFWRGFLLRWFVADDFQNVPMGARSIPAFAFVTIGFMMEHGRPDWPAALVAGALFNFVAYRTRNLSSCVLAHAITNAAKVAAKAAQANLAGEIEEALRSFQQRRAA